MVGKEKETKKVKRQQLRHQPLEQQIREGEDDGVRKVPRNKQPKKADVKKDYVDSDLTKKILGMTQKHVQEADDDEEVEQPTKKGVSFSNFNADDDEEDDMSENEDDYNNLEVEEITEEDERALSLFMSDGASQRVTLADIIMQKIKEKEQGMGSELSLAEKLHSTLSPKVIEVYGAIGKMLHSYSSGKMPKAFKIIPNLSNWEEILFLTNPETWSHAATYQATRVFASSLNAKMAQRFFNSILYPKVLDDIILHKKLNFHLFRSLKKATYKPAAFYRGIVLPLCESGECTLKVAVIFAALLNKISVPVLHSSAAILKIAEMKYSGTNSYFLSVLLNKKYALPYRVIDAVFNHFARFMEDDRTMHIVWHRSLMIFVQRYKQDLTREQKSVLEALAKKHYHSFFSEETKRELTQSISRGETQQDAAMDTN